jgi:hypothetical protein
VTAPTYARLNSQNELRPPPIMTCCGETFNLSFGGGATRAILPILVNVHLAGAMRLSWGRGLSLVLASFVRNQGVIPRSARNPHDLLWVCGYARPTTPATHAQAPRR